MAQLWDPEDERRHFFCLPLNMFSIFFCLLFRWIQWQGRGWPGQAERRGWHRSPRASVDGGETHHGAKTTTSTEYPVPPRGVSTWTVQSMQRGTKSDQCVVWRSLFEMNSWWASNFCRKLMEGDVPKWQRDTKRNLDGCAFSLLLFQNHLLQLHGWIVCNASRRKVRIFMLLVFWVQLRRDPSSSLRFRAPLAESKHSWFGGGWRLWPLDF